MSEAIKLKCKCSKVLKVPQKYGGKVIACPSCKQKLRVPEPILEVEEVDDDLELVEEPVRRRRPTNKKKTRRTPAAAPAADKMNAGEWVAGVFLFLAGPLIVIFWAMQGNAKWKPMLGLTAGMWLIFSGVLYYKFDDIVDYAAGTPAHFDDEYVAPSLTGPPPSDDTIPPGLLEEFQRQQKQAAAEAAAMMKPPSESELSGMDPIRQRAHRANVGIQSVIGAGSGVVCKINNDSTMILTNRHVIDPQFESGVVNINVLALPPVNVLYVEGSTLPGRVIWVAPDRVDLAIVQADAPKTGIASADLTPAKVKSHEEIFTVGNPIGLGWTYTEGKISAIRTRLIGETDVPIYQIDASINRGNSGGGLYNLKGQLIGINTSIINPELAQRLGFAIRTEFLRELNPPALKLRN
jgi:S1-C subfamily serine protease